MTRKKTSHLAHLLLAWEETVIDTLNKTAIIHDNNSEEDLVH